jgi:hypothetical protein
MSTLLFSKDGFLQDTWDNGLVPKKQVNVWISTDFSEAVRDLVPLVGPKKKWQIYAAAVLALLRLTPEERDSILAGIRAADYPGGNYKPLIEAAKARGRGEPRVAVVGVPTPPASNGAKPSGEAGGSSGPRPSAGGARGRRH